MRVIFLSVFISLSLIKAQAQIDTVVVKDFSKEWMFFDSKKKLPLVKKSDFEGNTIHFNLDQTAVENAYLAITYPSPFSVFLNGKLVQTAEGKLILSIENYLLTTSQLPVIIYSEKLNPYLLVTQSLKMIDTSLDPLEEDIVIVDPRELNVFDDYYQLSIIILAIFFTALYTYSPRSINEYFRIERALSPRELDENLLKTRIFTGPNFGVFVFTCLLLGHLIISTVYLSNIFPERELFYAASVSEYLWNWLKMSSLLMIGLFFKYVLLLVASSLFQVKDFFNSHFYNFLRLSLMIAFVLSLVTATVYLGIYNYPDAVYSAFYQMVLLATLPVILVIYLKLMNAASYKNLHLFSYLCATELIPFVIILSFGIY